MRILASNPGEFMQYETTNPEGGVEYTNAPATEDTAMARDEILEDEGDELFPPEAEPSGDDVDESAAEDAEETGDEDGDDEDAEEGDDADDGIEIEYEGQTYRVPPELKDAFLRNADYTRKTQVLASEKRKFEAERDHARQRDTVTAANIQDYARIVALSEKIQQFEALNWQALHAQDPVGAQRLTQDYAQAKRARNEAAQNFQQRIEQRSREEQQETAKRVAEGHAVLSRDIPDWSPELGAVLKHYAVNNFGITPDEIGSVTDPRLVKVIFAALLGDLRAYRARQGAARSAVQSAAQKTRPVPQVRSGGATATKNPAHMSDAEYIAWRAKGGGD